MKSKHYIKDLFLRHRLYWVLGALVLLYVLSFYLSVLFGIANLVALFLFIFLLLDYALLFFTTSEIKVERTLEDVLSLGDQNKITLDVQSDFNFPLSIQLIDEIPLTFQERNFSLNEQLKKQESKKLSYTLRPTNRGSYSFGSTYIYAHTRIGLLQRRFVNEEAAEVKVYPSFLALKQYSLRGIAARESMTGSLKVRRGASTEFDQIKEYVRGDDVRRINWKASARKGEFMVNQFTDEKSQQVFCMIDKSRLMKMPFNEISLLDYAINASLMFTYVALQKDDKVGLMTFSKKVDDLIKPSKNRKQFSVIVDRLYNQTTAFEESNYEAVQLAVRKDVGQRSLLFLFTNFENYIGFERKLPYFKMLNRKHLLCVILFENTSLKSIYTERGNELEDIYIKTMADKYNYEKKMMLKELRKNGILSIYSAPEQLSVNVVNKYLDLKTKRFI